MTAPIALASEPPIEIGPLRVYPPTLEIGRDGRKVVVEPRVMRVLVALAHADGAVVTRDELILRCWDGRIVGDDAIHRVLSRLRRLTEGIAKDVFRVETITKVGYRLAASQRVPAGSTVDGVSLARAPRAVSPLMDRRVMLATAGVAAVSVAGGLWLGVPPRREPPVEAQALLARARGSMREGTQDQIASAVSMLRRAAEIAPDHAPVWGALALAYQQDAMRSGWAERVQSKTRARAAAERALALDSDNDDALAALATLTPCYQRWTAYEADCRRVLTRHPNHWTLNQNYGFFLGQVGRPGAAVLHYGRAMDSGPLSPLLQSLRAMALWSAGRLDEADAAIDRAFAMWPLHHSVWFARIRLYNYSERAMAARAMIADRESHPPGLADWNVDLSRTEAVAFTTFSPADIDAAMAGHRSAAERGLVFAENAVLFAAAVGRLDDAFAIMMGYFFDIGFTLDDQNFPTQRGASGVRRQRFTAYLFTPPTEALRADPRFDRLMRAIGLATYWRKAGLPPDYQAA